MEMETRYITNKMDTVNDIAAQNLSCLATTMDQHFILERTKLYDQVQVPIMETEKRYIANKMGTDNGIAAQNLFSLATASIIERNQEAEEVVERSPSKLGAMDAAITSVRVLSPQHDSDVLVRSLICTDSKIERTLRVKEVERQVMQDHDKCQAALCHLIVFGYEKEIENENEHENEHENEAAQCILRGSNLDSEICLNSIKKDGNFLRDKSSHEASADDGSFKEANGKDEGEKKRVSLIFYVLY